MAASAGRLHPARRFGRRTRRPTREGPRLQGRSRGAARRQEDRLDERQVRGRDRCGDRQDRREARVHGRRDSPSCRYTGRQAAPGGGQVRRLRRDRHQRSAETGHPGRGADGVAVRRHRPAEPGGAGARADAAAEGPARSAARSHSCRGAGGLAAPHRRRCGAIAGWRCRRASALEDAVFVPPMAEFYGAIGAIEWGKRGAGRGRTIAGLTQLADYLRDGRRQRTAAVGGTRAGRVARRAGRVPGPGTNGAVRRAGSPGRNRGPGLRRYRRRLDVDQGGAAVAGRRGARQGLPALEGQPDPGHRRDVRGASRSRSSRQGAALEVLGVGTTGYAKDIVRAAHRRRRGAGRDRGPHPGGAARAIHDVDVISDVGGQDIKVIFMRDGRVADFRLNTQCSAGNGYYLQATAESFGVAREGLRRRRVHGADRCRSSATAAPSSCNPTS